MGALAVFTFLGNWNNFLVPLLYLPSGDYRPLTTGLYMFTGGRSMDIGPLAAGTLITIVPVLVRLPAVATTGHRRLHLRRRQGLTQRPSTLRPSTSDIHQQ